ncbi:MAG: DUF3598 family protein [Okeania sp. SIO2F4]|uniref:DUF3598 family protein n=1 Tax=Okeania sp. SIO2F4 TaxID=2607790 RepID=UPI00142B46E6|nr:DUF3598 family protein [Okeania sp. SIO2F4]NES07282.1 DUF3598 family protein [Okeania sp. SIO2F4]
MKTQWENFLQNLGEWHGSFTNISAKGEILKDTPSILILESLDDQNKQVRLTLRRFNSFAKTPESKVDEIVSEYQTLGRNLLFFENGAFSKGVIQIAPFSINGAEFGFVNKNRRLRLVELFNKDGNFDKLTLIREKRAGTDASENPPLTVDALLGKWHGEAITMYPDLREPDTYPTQMELNIDNTGRLVQEITFGDTHPKTLTSTARIEGSILHFDQSSQPVKIVLLPDGASATLPVKIELRKPLFFELGWLIEPQLRQRLIRSYNDKGEWVSSTLVTEEKIK